MDLNNAAVPAAAFFIKLIASANLLKYKGIGKLFNELLFIVRKIFYS
jgi:hypothetical protein